MKSKVLVLLIALGLSAVACPDGGRLQSGPCDAPTLVFEPSCSGSRCHEGNSLTDRPEGWLDLLLPGLEARVVSGEDEFAHYPELEGEGCPTDPERIVDLEEVNESLMMKKLLGTHSCGDSMPPPPYEALTAQDIACVRGWIQYNLAETAVGGAGGEGSP